jgi:hypothetical protein
MKTMTVEKAERQVVQCRYETIDEVEETFEIDRLCKAARSAAGIDEVQSRLAENSVKIMIYSRSDNLTEDEKHEVKTLKSESEFLANKLKHLLQNTFIEVK